MRQQEQSDRDPRVMLVKLTAKDSEMVTNALIKSARKLPQELYKSLTWDRGTETAAHKRFTWASRGWTVDIQPGEAGRQPVRSLINTQILEHFLFNSISIGESRNRALTQEALFPAFVI